MKLLSKLAQKLSLEPKRLIKFAGKWVDSKLPVPAVCTFFFGHITASEIQVLLGSSNFVTDDIHPLFIASLSPQKTKEMYMFLANVVKTYEDKFGTIELPPPPVPPTTIH